MIYSSGFLCTSVQKNKKKIINVKSHKQPNHINKAVLLQCRNYNKHVTSRLLKSINKATKVKAMLITVQRPRINSSEMGTSETIWELSVLPS